tara:strand:- start:137 stop:472 length:336 start_codon:yes stop_codon:yes gene_type:complete
MKDVNENPESQSETKTRESSGIKLAQDDGSMREVFLDELDAKTKPQAERLLNVLQRRDRAREAYQEALDVIDGVDDLVKEIDSLVSSLNNNLPPVVNMKIQTGLGKPKNKG